MGFLSYLKGFTKANRNRTISKQKLPAWDMYGERIDRRDNIIKLNPNLKVRTMGAKESSEWDKKFEDFKKRIIG